MLRRLRVLAAFFMLPVVLFATPTQAAAATTAGDWETFSIYVPAADIVESADLPGIDCSFSLQHAGGYSINVGKGFCIGLPDVTWGYSQAGEAGSYFAISVTGVSDTGSCSGSSGSTLGPHARNGTVNVAGTITSGSFGVSQPDCTLTNICIALAGGTPYCTSGSVSPNEEEEPESGCEVGTAEAWLEYEPAPQTPGQLNYDKVFLNWRVNGAPTVYTASWGFFVWFPDWGPKSTGAALTGNSGRVEVFNVARYGSGTPATPLGRIEMYAAYPGSWNSPPRDSKAETVAGVAPYRESDAYLGITDPERCRFYYGDKFLSFPDTEVDEPAGDGVNVPPPPPPPVEPPVEPVIDEPEPVDDEPADDLGWLAKIWALLSSILQKIAGLAASIATAIRDMLYDFFDAVFLPEDGYLKSRYTGTEQLWEDTSPAKYSAAFETFSVGSGSGCSGMPLNLTLPGGVAVNQNIGAACSGSMASAAGVVRGALTAVFVVGGMVACVRALGSGLGWNPGVGRGGAA